MEDIIFLFLYHRLDEVTRRHFDLLRRFHPRDEIVPLAYQLKIAEVLPGTIDVALDWDYSWPVFNVWHEMDKIYMRWFLRPLRPRARRYVFFEYDILANTTAPVFYGTAWNAEVAVATIQRPNTEPEWHWWSHASRLGASYPHRMGVVPMAATLWTDDVLRRIAVRPQLQNVTCELRLGTMLNMLGVLPTVIPNAATTISWRAQDILVTDTPTWFHPVKS